MLHNSPNQQDRDQDSDQRHNNCMEDTTAMTIEFLRARLLSERAVSRTARQRADELEKRVVELEEQLRFVSLQRKKAERATADVLAILENHGISEFSEEFDSSSDREVTNCESKVGNNSVEDESAVALKVRGNDTEEVSGFELESGPLLGRRLSWKSGKDLLHSCEKRRVNSSTRRRSSFPSIGSPSPRQRAGKSCRQIRQRETRSAVGELQTDAGMLSPQGNEVVATCPECFPNCSGIGSGVLGVGSENQDKEVPQEVSVSGGLEKQNDIDTTRCYFNGHGSDKDMEKALEHQAQLIERHEAEEKAQREWEEKFRENNSSTPDSCEPGNQSDITEERDERAPAPPYPAGKIPSEDQGVKSKMGEVDLINESSKSNVNGFQPPPRIDTGCLHDPICIGAPSKSPVSDFAFPMAKGKEIQESSQSYGQPPLHDPDHHLRPHPQSSLVSQSSHRTSSSKSVSSVFDREEKKNELGTIPHDTSDKFGSVLDALQQAKLSLKHNLNKFPVRGGTSVGNSVESTVPGRGVGDRAEVPVGCAGLFRVPADFHSEATTRANFLGSGSQLSLTNYPHDTGIPITGGDRFMTSSFLELKPRVPIYEQFLTIPSGPYGGSRSQVPSDKAAPFEPRLPVGIPSSSRYTFFDPNLDTSLLPSNRYAYPSYPFYQDLMPRIPSTGELSKPLSNGESGTRPATHFSFYDDHIRSNMYR